MMVMILTWSNKCSTSRIGIELKDETSIQQKISTFDFQCHVMKCIVEIEEYQQILGNIWIARCGQFVNIAIYAKWGNCRDTEIFHSLFCFFYLFWSKVCAEIYQTKEMLHKWIDMFINLPFSIYDWCIPIAKYTHYKYLKYYTIPFDIFSSRSAMTTHSPSSPGPHTQHTKENSHTRSTDSAWSPIHAHARRLWVYYYYLCPTCFCVECVHEMFVCVCVCVVIRVMSCCARNGGDDIYLFEAASCGMGK